MTPTNAPIPNLDWPMLCLACGWRGTQAEIMVGTKPKAYCPKCESMDLRHEIATETRQ